MEENSIAIIPAAHEVTRSYDTEFKFRQIRFWYLTGFLNLMPLLSSIRRIKAFYTLYVRPRDPMMETWFGRRAGVEAP